MAVSTLPMGTPHLSQARVPLYTTHNHAKGCNVIAYLTVLIFEIVQMLKVLLL